MRMLAMANVDAEADTKKARLTPARLTRDRVRAKHTNATKVAFNPGRDGGKSGRLKTAGRLSARLI